MITYSDGGLKQKPVRHSTERRTFSGQELMFVQKKQITDAILKADFVCSRPASRAINISECGFNRFHRLAGASGDRAFRFSV